MFSTKHNKWDSLQGLFINNECGYLQWRDYYQYHPMDVTLVGQNLLRLLLSGKNNPKILYAGFPLRRIYFVLNKTKHPGPKVEIMKVHDRTILGTPAYHLC